MNVKETLIRKGHRALLHIRKESPTILTVAGIGLGLAATGFAIKNTLDVDKVLNKREERLQAVAKNRFAADKDEDDEIVYTEAMEKRDKQKVAVTTVAEMAVHYSPTIILSGASVLCILTAHHILDGRLSASMAAFAALDAHFKDYRGKVVKEYGADKDREFYRSIETVDEINDKGKKTGTVKKVHKDPEYDDGSRYFDELSINWDEHNPDMNVAYLRAQEHYANDKLRSQGYLFLNDVYSMFDIPATSQGQILGWLYDDDHLDAYIDFGVDNGTDDPFDFANDMPWDGRMGILLHFNTQGIIYDKI